MRLQDVRYALRGLWHSKGFAATAILCLGFGIGLNTTIFSIMDGVLLKPYPYTDPDRLRVIGTRFERNVGTSGLSYLDMRDWKEANTSFTTIAAVAGRSMAVSDSGGEPERYLGAGVSWDLFPLLGIAPALGHGFSREDDTPGGGGVVIISHDLWTRRYSQDPNVLGRTILVNAKAHTIIGVMPPGFAFPNTQRLWVPLEPMVAKDARNVRGLFAFGRLKPGVTAERARQELDAVASRLAQTYPDTNRGWTSSLQSLREEFLPAEVSVVIYCMMAGATLVLFIACSNVASLLLSRATARRREISLRTALGASRAGIIRQLLTEGVVLNLISVPLGVLLAVVGTRLIASLMPVDQVPYYITWQVDWRSLVYTVAIAVATALIFGVFPALQVTRGNLHDSLKGGTRGNSGSRSRLRNALVVTQIALALVALVGALLFVRTFSNLNTAELGFETKPLMTMRFYMTGEPYETADARIRRVEDIVGRVEALPGVQAVFASNFVPLSGGGGGGRAVIDGKPAVPGEETNITVIGVTPGLARTLALPPVRGRDFTSAEGSTRAPVALITRAMGKYFWADEEPIGRRFRVTGIGTEADWFTIIGILPDANFYGLEPGNEQPPLVAFVPFAFQHNFNVGLTIRVAGDPASVVPGVRARIREADPNLPLAMIRTMEDTRRLSFWQYGLYGWVFGTIGTVGLLLASVGVYGVLSFSVAQRTQEMGVRLALGASRRDLLSLVVGQGLLLSGIGVAVGLVFAPVLTWFARELLFRVSAFDPVSFTAVAVVLLAVAALASYLPARRAMRVDPVVALRGE